MQAAPHGGGAQHDTGVTPAGVALSLGASGFLVASAARFLKHPIPRAASGSQRLPTRPRRLSPPFADSAPTCLGGGVVVRLRQPIGIRRVIETGAAAIGIDVPLIDPPRRIDVLLVEKAFHISIGAIAGRTGGARQPERKKPSNRRS